MAWKIIFKYFDNNTLKISGKHKQLPQDLAEQYFKEYARPGRNDGGMVYISPFKKCEPVPLVNYIKEKEA